MVEKYGKLEVLSREGRFAQVKCECGTEKQVGYYDMKNGKIVSCGCAFKAEKHHFIDGIEYKRCTKCKELKILDCFAKLKAKWDGLRTECKPCMNIVRNKRMKQRRIENPEWKEKDNQRLRKYDTQEYREIKAKRNKERRKTDAEFVERERKQNREYMKFKRTTDQNFRLACNIRSRLYASLKGLYKCQRTLELLGCSLDELKLYIEKQFKPGMEWSGYGRKGWVLDHIRPINSFDLSDPEQQKICFHYTNLQPLPWDENLKKSDRLDWKLDTTNSPDTMETQEENGL